MKVILKQAVAKLGKQGQVVTVKDGYARNFLFPNGMAILADKTQLEVLARRQAKVAAEHAATKAAAEATRDAHQGKTIKIAAKVGRDSGKLFGAITSQDIADAIKAQLGLAVEKRAVLLPQPIKRLGRHDLELDIHPLVDMKLHLNVYDAEHPETAEDEAPAELVEA